MSANDGKFFKAFKDNMEAMGLPAPSSIFGTLTTAMGTIGALAGAVAKWGMKATLAEIALTIPTTAGGAAIAAGVAEIAQAVGALALAFYVGACIGSLIAAAIDTWGISAVGKISIWLQDLSKRLGMSVSDFLKIIMKAHPRASYMRVAYDQVRSTESGGGGQSSYAYA